MRSNKLLKSTTECSLRGPSLDSSERLFVISLSRWIISGRRRFCCCCCFLCLTVRLHAPAQPDLLDAAFLLLLLLPRALCAGAAAYEENVRMVRVCVLYTLISSDVRVGPRGQGTIQFSKLILDRPKIDQTYTFVACVPISPAYISGSLLLSAS